MHDTLCRKNKQFSLLADELQQHSLFRNTPMESFLGLPYRRITRMPLLMEAVAKRVHLGDNGYQELQDCLEVVKKVHGIVVRLVFCGHSFLISRGCFYFYCLLFDFIFNYRLWLNAMTKFVSLITLRHSQSSIAK